MVAQIKQSSVASCYRLRRLFPQDIRYAEQQPLATKGLTSAVFMSMTVSLNLANHTTYYMVEEQLLPQPRFGYTFCLPE